MYDPEIEEFVWVDAVELELYYNSIYYNSISSSEHIPSASDVSETYGFDDGYVTLDWESKA